MATITIRQHIPAFIAGSQPCQATVKTLADLLELPWVGTWKTGCGDRAFYRFSLGRPEALEAGQAMLMAELGSGRPYYVVGYVQSDEPLDLPIWSAPDE